MRRMTVLLACALPLAIGALVAARPVVRTDRAHGMGDTITDLPTITFTTADGVAAPMRVEVADDPREWQCGLMYRTELPDDQGMLFAFTYDYYGGFWNKNTLIPLSVAYVSGDGTIEDIVDMEAIRPGEEPTIQQPRLLQGGVRYVIEANLGWYDRHGIGIGDRVDVSAALLNADAAAPPPIAPC